MQKIAIKNKREMTKLAAQIANESPLNQTYLLNGTLGAGKTFFASAFINSLLPEKKEILSPTFNLVSHYKTSKRDIFHFDFYRLKREEELEEIGFFDALKNGICLIEWPEIAQDFFPKNAINIDIKILDKDNREIKIY